MPSLREEKNGSCSGGGLFTTMGGFHGYRPESVLVTFGHYKDSWVFILSSPGGGGIFMLGAYTASRQGLSSYSCDLQPKPRRVTQSDT